MGGPLPPNVDGGLHFRRKCGFALKIQLFLLPDPFIPKVGPLSLTWRGVAISVGKSKVWGALKKKNLGIYGQNYLKEHTKKHEKTQFPEIPASGKFLMARYEKIEFF